VNGEQKDGVAVPEQKSDAVIRRVVAGKLEVEEAGVLLGLSARQIRRLKSRFVERGAADLAKRRPGGGPERKRRVNNPSGAAIEGARRIGHTRRSDRVRESRLREVA